MQILPMFFEVGEFGDPFEQKALHVAVLMVVFFAFAVFFIMNSEHNGMKIKNLGSSKLSVVVAQDI